MYLGSDNRAAIIAGGGTLNSFERRHCMNKRQFDSRHDAIVAARLIGGSRGKKYKVYRCTLCPYHHLATA